MQRLSSAMQVFCSKDLFKLKPQIKHARDFLQNQSIFQIKDSKPGNKKQNLPCI
jgi:hypothetical protein